MSGVPGWEVKFDGKDYPVKGDPGNTMISYRKVNDHTIDETDKRNGKIVNTARITVSADGKKMTYAATTSSRAGITRWS